MDIKPFGGEVFNHNLYGGSHPSWYGEDVTKNINNLIKHHVSRIYSLESDRADLFSALFTTLGSSNQHILEIKNIPISIEDFEAPTLEQLHLLVEHIMSNLEDDKSVFVHCRGGLGRTGTVLAAIYMAKTQCGAEEAIHFTRETYSSWAIETKSQVQSLYDYEEYLKSNHSNTRENHI